MSALIRFVKKLNKKKVFQTSTMTETKLARKLNALDLTALGVGSTLGVGLYVLAGSVSKSTAGPAVILSFLLAAIASVFAGLCYAEFGARVPRAGSAYVYSYVCVGELVAFIIGWNLILEYAIGAASVARGVSAYVDGLADGAMKNAFNESMPMHIEVLSMKFAEYPDFFACGMTLIFVVALAFGAKESSTINNLFTFLNIGVVLYVIVTGAFKADGDNWAIPKEELPSNEDGGVFGEGGFFPYGVSGMISGAATCFYGFVGFDCVATTGEEAKNPQKAIPIAIIASLTIIFLAYFGVSSVLTLMLPYYAQDADSPIPSAFEAVGWPVAKWIVSIGAIFGLLTSLFGALFPLPRVIYAMSSDGLLFRSLGKVSERFKTPVFGTLIAGLLTALMTLIFDLEELVDMMSIGTLMAYSIVAACVLLLRYQKTDEDIDIEPVPADSTFRNVKRILLQIFNIQKLTIPISVSGKIVSWNVLIYFAACLALTACVANAEDAIVNEDALAISGVVIFGIIALLSLLSIARQPSSRKKLSFKVPFVPLLPGLSILINVYLMMMLNVGTWKRFGIWMAIGKSFLQFELLI
ncbi:hypothetical protein ANN_04384 [Periplaneta americana]|uniref:Cationic amino acid transporter C-terminal domain-containing protein n=1 Tax=Periplaneta americana TaxID=6978 RepID=A0ABQ8T9L5_PERAM|nr:hypothetical protein ANN_04384 [Periplaneta americana]